MARERGGASGDDGAQRGDAHEKAVAEQRWVADELAGCVRGASPHNVPARLCEVCLRLLPVSGVSLSVTGDGSGMRATLCASDEVAAQLAEIQYTLGEGPCVQAGDLRAPVFAADLTDGPDSRRWPLFAAQAVQAGARAVFSVPLGGVVRALGTLDLYRETVGSLTPREVRIALLAADAITLAVTALHRRSEDAEGVVAWLEGAEADREEVYQAAGMIMVQLGVDADEALARLRARAFAQGRTATDVARDIVNRTLDIDGHD